MALMEPEVPQPAGDTPARFNIRFGVTSVQGKRKTMEDAHALHPDVDEAARIQSPAEHPASDSNDADAPSGAEPETVRGSTPLGSFFGVYDGHGGQRAAEFVSENLHRRVVEEAAKAPLLTAMERAFQRVEADWMAQAVPNSWSDGTTAVVVVVGPTQKLTIGNVGDSEAVLCRKGVAQVLTVVHNVARNPDERKRIEDCGGKIWSDRLAHPALNPKYFSIAVSRSIGDLMFKSEKYTHDKPSGLIAAPSLAETQLVAGEDEFLLLACDGLFDVFSAQEATDFVRESLKRHANDPTPVTSELVDAALEKGTSDNVTVVLLVFSA